MFTGLVESVGTVDAIESLGDSVRLTIADPVVTSDATHGASIAVNGCCLTAVDIAPGRFSADVMAESLNRTSLGELEVGSPVNLERAMTAGGRLGGHIVQGHVDGTGRLIDRTPSTHWDVLRFSLPDELARYLVEKGSITVQGVSLTVVEVVDRTSSHEASSHEGPLPEVRGGTSSLEGPLPEVRGGTTSLEGPLPEVRGGTTSHEGPLPEVRGGTTSHEGWFSVSLIPTTLADTTLGTLTPGDAVNLEVDVLAKYVERLLDHRKGATDE